jgi:acyl-CoA thioesterase-1
MRCIFLVLALLSPSFLCAMSFEVPSVGSIWEYQMSRQNFETGASLLGGTQRILVERVQHGRPVFSVKLGGKKLELFEHDEGVAVIEDGCQEHFTPKPSVLAPNMCGWNPCTVQPGQTLEWKLYVLARHTGCKPGVFGTARYRGVKRESVGLLGILVEATHTEAFIDIPNMGSASWNPYIKDGEGEIYSSGAGGREEAIYTKVSVLGVRIELGEISRYTPPTKLMEKDTETPAMLTCEEKPGLRTWIALGDSLTAGGDGSYPNELQALLHASSVRLLNAGIAGDTTEKILRRLESVIACKPEVVLLEIGGNDIFQGVTRSVFEERLGRIISGLQGEGIGVVLLGLEIGGASPYSGSYVQVAEKFQVAMIPNILLGVHGVPDMISDDGIHPNNKGYKIIAGTVYNFLSSAPSSI